MALQDTLQLTSPVLTNPVDILPVIFTPHPPFPSSITLSPSIEISRHLTSLNHIGTFHLLPLDITSQSHHNTNSLTPLLKHMHENNVSYCVEFPGQQLIISPGKTTLLASFDGFSQYTHPGVDFSCTFALVGQTSTMYVPVWIRLEKSSAVDVFGPTEWPELIFLEAEQVISLQSDDETRWPEPILRIENKSPEVQKMWSALLRVLQDRLIGWYAEIGGCRLCFLAGQTNERDGLELTGAVTLRLEIIRNDSQESAIANV